MKKLLLIGLLTVSSAAALWADSPQRLNFQGRLLDNNKNPRNGNLSMTFRLCATEVSSCGSPLWNETQTVGVSNGVFSVQLGSITAIAPSVFASATTYLEIEVAGETLSPRERLAASAYAFKAMMAEDVEAGSTNYIQLTASLQANSTFYVSSATVLNDFRVGGVITAGSASTQITQANGLINNAALDVSSVTKLGNAVNSADGPVKLDSSSQLPAVSGALLTNLWPSNVISSATVIGTSTTITTTETQILSVTITVTGSNRVLILAKGAVDNTATTAFNGILRVRRGATNGSTLVDQAETYQTNVAAQVQTIPLMAVDTPGAGAITYTLRGWASASTVRVGLASLIVMEIK